MTTPKHNHGFTLIELMVAMVVGLATISAAYTIGSTLTQQFHEQTRISRTQGSLRSAVEELKRDIGRAGLFYTPRVSLESSCINTVVTLPSPSGGTTQAGGLQYFDGDDSIVDPSGVNTGVRSDTLRLMGNFVTENKFQLAGFLGNSVSRVVFDIRNQGFKDTFQTRPYAELAVGIPEMNALFDSVWTNTPVHIVDNDTGKHFFNFATGSGLDANNHYFVELQNALPRDSASCISNNLSNATISPISFVEYKVVNPTDGSSDIDLADLTPADNRVLVRRLINPTSQALIGNSVSVVAEYVVNFSIGFYLENPVTGWVFLDGSDAKDAIANNPERLRAVVVDLWVRTPKEDSRLPFVAPVGSEPITTFDVNTASEGSARIRKVRFQVPLPSIALRSL
ncbi:MAG: prepilin-type N-terminal cleavage/methylation domain-containing protein [Polyangiales bacterium]